MKLTAVPYTHGRDDMAPQATASTLPTRQQLDEIDALLRRLLATPPAGTDTPTPAAPAHQREFGGADPHVQSWRVEWPSSGASTSNVATWGAPVPVVPPPVPFAAPVVPPYAAPMPTQTATTMPQPQYVEQPPPSRMRPPIPGHFWPLVVVNFAFDVLSYLLGPIGTWARERGRTVLGWAGGLMVVVSIAWAGGEWTGFDWSSLELKRWFKFLD